MSNYLAMRGFFILLKNYTHQPYLYRPHIWAAFSWVVILTLFGRILTDIGPWYFNLQQPSIKPPDYAFGIVWTTIFLLSGLAFVKAWEASSQKKERQQLVFLFVINGLLNMLWSFLFFRMHRPDWSLIAALFLWASVGLIMVTCYPYSRLAAGLMLPYLAWVSFAIALNDGIVDLNSPFN